MGRIRELQYQHQEWVAHNFPDNDPDQAFLGMVEEVGELAHVRLKLTQGIRGMTPDQALAAERDALGDLFVFMMSYCNATDMDLEKIVDDTWGEVRQRDWVKFPKDGLTE